MMKRILLSLIAVTMPTVANADTHDVYGLWLTQAETAHIEVTDCGNGTPCGALIWVAPTLADAGIDARNVDKSLRARPLVGVPIVWGYERGKKKWRNGRIYNPEDGKTFKSTMRLQENGTLKVKGCLGPLCITNIWTPIPLPSNRKRHK